MSDTFPTLTSILEPGALGNWLSTTYPLADPVVCEFFRHGINDTYIVMSDESRYFFRVYRHGWRTDAQVAAEVDQLALLARHGIPVAAAVPDRDGALVQRLLAAEGLRPAILTHAAPGVIKKRPSDVECHRVGQLMAQIHHVWDVHPQHGHRPSWFSPELVAYPMATVGDQFGRFSDKVEWMKRLAAEVQREIQRESSAWADVGLIHADLHAENVHFHSDGSLALFDFDLLGTGWRAYDLAVFFWSRHLLARDTGHADQGWQAFLQGYLTHRSLPDADRQAVPLLAAARQIWIMGLHTGPPTRHYGRRWLDKRYLQKHLTLLGSLASRVPQLEHFASEPQH